MPRHSPRTDLSSSLSFWALATFLTILWMAGGASRADAAGQVVVRFSAWIILIAFVLAVPRVDWRQVRAPIIFLGAMILLVAIQLIPLPPGLWTLFPGRDVLEGAARVSGEQQPWRPLSISPSATANALGSLVVPVVVLLLAANQTRTQHWRIVTLLLGLTVAGSLLGLLQFSGARFDHPLVNDISGMVSAIFANRNHFALFLAIGCMVALTWAFEGENQRWKMFVALGIVILFALMILATGSRTGMLLGAIGVALGLAIVRRRAFRELTRIPRRLAILLVLLGVLFVAGALWLSISLDRAASIERVLTLDAEEDLRAAGVPIVIDMIVRYFPTGTGFGTFDPAFRISEPDSFLRPSYFNRAHNDWLEVILDGGILAALLLVVALAWFTRRSLVIWFRRDEKGSRLAQLGSAIILLTLIASVVDYPARTPMIMAILALAAAWLARRDVGGTAQRFSPSEP